MTDPLRSLLHACHLLAPDEFAAAVAAHAAGLGAQETVLYLADYGQSTLLPLPGDGVPERLLVVRVLDQALDEPVDLGAIHPCGRLPLRATSEQRSMQKAAQFPTVACALPMFTIMNPYPS